MATPYGELSARPDGRLTVPDPATPVAIVGAGPVGLALALGLARHGVRSVVFEREATTSEHSKAAGIHIRTREVLRRWGVEDRFLAEGELVARIVLHDVARGERPLLALDLDDLAAEADRPGLLMLEQRHTERLLLGAVRATDHAEVVFGAEVVDLWQGPNGVELAVDTGDAELRHVSAAYVVGCDGASSFVRDALQLPFEGTTYALRPMLADVAVDDARDRAAWPRLHDGREGLTTGLRLAPGLWRIIHLTTRAPDGDEVPDAEVQRRVDTVLGPGPVDVVWSSRFTIHRRSSPRFRVGRVLLAGDAAHVHSPVGGQGMNAGVQDAHDLAWRLAAALDGADADRLLDAYDVERRGVVVGTVSRTTDLATRLVLQAPSVARRGAFALQRAALRIPAVRRRALRRLGMLDLHLPASPLLPADDPAAGARLPDPVVTTPRGSTVRLQRLLPVGWALLEVDPDRTGPGVEQQPGAARGLPVEAVLRFGRGGLTDRSGTVARLLHDAEGWILVRPDGHVGWARPGPTGADTDTAALAAAVRASAGR
jgi:2-polyprenyl-6-methoxyphenol hydroxylase-like FAD-dependent oxidoreductase